MNQKEVNLVCLPKIDKSILTSDPSWANRTSPTTNRRYSWIARVNPNLNSFLIKYTRLLSKEPNNNSNVKPNKGPWFNDHSESLIIVRSPCYINSKENKIMPIISKSSSNLNESITSRRTTSLSRCRSSSNPWSKSSTSNNPWSHKEDISRWETRVL